MKKTINIVVSILLFGALGVLVGVFAYFAFLFGDDSFGRFIVNFLLASLIVAPYIITIILTVKYLKGDLQGRSAKILLILLSLVWLVILSVLYGVYVSMANINYMGRIYVTILIPIIVVAAILVLVFNNIRLKKTFFFSMLSLMLVFVISYVSVDAYYNYQDKITLNNLDAIDTTRYLAFDQNSKIARLEGEASLRFSEDDDLPVVDGAAALFPMFSAFVEATYPSSIPELNAKAADGEVISPYTYFNTVDGYKRLIEGKCDVMFAAAPSEQQINDAAKKGVEFELIPIGLESFIFFVNDQNPIDSLTVEQLKGIYSGQITNWKEVGGKKKKIIAYQRNEGSGSQTALVRFMGDTPLYDNPPEIIHTMMGFIERVAYRNNSGAIGFSFRYYAESIVANGNIKVLRLDGVEATVENIKNGSYPISDPFYMVVRKGERTDELSRLIEWVLSEEGQYLVEKSGYASINQD